MKIKTICQGVLALGISLSLYGQEEDFVETGTVGPLFGSTFGLNTTNTFFQSTDLKDGLFTGLFRPYYTLTYDKKIELMIRGKLDLKYYPIAPANTKQESISTAMEVLSVDFKGNTHNLKMGRAFYATGQQVLFANFADGVSYNLNTSPVSVMVMGLYSGEYDGECGINTQGCGPSQNAFNTIPNLSTDAKVTGLGKRAFGIIEISSAEILRSKALLYGLYSQDMVSDGESVKVAYHPYYGGLGFIGQIVIPELRYRIDGIYQAGKSYNLVSNNESVGNHVQAWAALWNLEYTLPFAKKYLAPQINNEISIASGDSDKVNVQQPSQTNVSGNDNAFYSFGSFSAGLALRPSLTNIQVYRLGITMKPLRYFYALRNLGLNFKGTLYRKSIPGGFISDPAANLPNADIGWALDTGLIFNARADINFFYGFGYFQPGAAYTVKDHRTAHTISVNWNF